MNVATAITRLRDSGLRHINPEQVLAQASKSLPPWLSLVLAVALAWNVGQIVWLVVPMPAPGAVAPPPADLPPLGDPGAGTASSGPGADVQVIVDAHLFGQFNASQPPPPEKPEGPDAGNLKDTDLPLKLLGVLADEAGGGQAVIVSGRGDARVYKVGDRVDGQNASIDGVYAEWVRLRRGNGMERLTLPDFDASAVTPRTRQRNSAGRRDRRANANSGAQALLDELAKSGGIQLTDLLRPQPVFEGGELAGYRVYPGRDRQTFSKLGLRPGDMVTQVNGTQLDDPAKGFEIFKQLEAGIPIAVTVERGGQVETIVLDIGSLDLGAP